MSIYESFWLPLTWIQGAVALNLVASWALVKSKGFRVKIWALVSVVFISGAFGCMAQAILVLPLSIAYALWAAMGIVCTVFLGKFCFNQHLSKQKYVAISLLATGIVLMNLA